MIARRASLTLAASVLMTAQAVAQPQPQVHVLPDVVVTATGRPESMTRIAGTMQVISQERIEKSSAKNVTDLLAENAVGFMSQWTQAQTSLNIRGAATEGQGRDFRSQILILVNGHRAGTANVSKLSVADVERIEIVRGPSSVVYGSQNMGGVVNIILKNGRTAPGNLFEGATGSWSLIEGKAQTGGTDGQLAYYFGANAGTQSEYQVGGGQVERNTQWTRFGATAALGWDFSDDHRVDVVARTDGVYDAGFRGSSANLFAYDTRYNQSVDVTYNGKSADGGMSLMFQTYYVRDVDDLNNPSPLSTLNAVASRTNVDRNRRQLDIVGARFQPGFKPWAGNEFLLGIDWERSWIRSERFRRGGSAVTQLSPQDNNQTENVFGFYVEDAQRFLDDRVTVRGGVRYTTGATALDWTPNAPTLIPGTTSYNATTYSAGATFQITDWLTARAGSSTGFRAPTATELGANFTTTPIGTTIFGNPGLAPETAQQIEAGATLNWGFGRFDAAIFQNLITNRIQAVTVSSIGGRVIQRFQNNPANIQVQGVEFQLDADVLKTLSLDVSPSWQWSVFGNGYYNFKMTDYGAVAAAGTDMATRINQYQAAIGTRFGQVETRFPWNLQILGILRGPMWYNTEEALSPVFFPGQVRNTTVYRKAPFWVWNTRGEIEVRKGITLFAAVNNIFDMNQHPIFIALDTNPCGANLPQQNGSCGNSMPGREVIVGFQLRW
ncbi:MAG: TonB-dependent receptor [Enhydrobacter sp.]|nr:MAG: TonB-dependent receptor [Enhydrobacter sp.]